MFVTTTIFAWIFLAMLSAMVAMVTDSPFVVWCITIVVGLVMALSGLSGAPMPDNDIVRGIMCAVELYALSGWLVVGVLAFLEDF